MKLSAFLLSVFLPVAITKEVAVRVVLTATSVSTTMQPEIDTKMKKVKEVVAKDLDALSEPDRRALRGQDRNLSWCTDTCTGFRLGYCWLNMGFSKSTCGGWRELEVLPEEELEQLGEDESHRHLSAASQCNKAISAVNATIKSQMTAAALDIVQGNLEYTCYFYKKQK